MVHTKRDAAVPSGNNSQRFAFLKLNTLQHFGLSALVGGNFSDSVARRVCSKVKQAFNVFEQFLATPIKTPAKFIVLFSETRTQPAFLRLLSSGM
jgi:hypothetical protein